MKNVITALVLAVTLGFASTSFAGISSDDIDLRGLSEVDKAAIVAAAEKARVANAAGPAITPKAAQEWAEFGAQIGKGLAATAKELGIAANEILTTPVGMLTAGLLVWHFAGEDLVGIMFGIGWLLVFCPVWIVMYRRLIYKTTVRTFDKGEGPNGAKKEVVREALIASTDKTVRESIQGMSVVYFIILFLGIVTPLFAIFG